VGLNQGITSNPDAPSDTEEKLANEPIKIHGTKTVKAKFRYAIWFEPAPNQLA